MSSSLLFSFPSMSRDPSKWSTKALDNYQRARSSSTLVTRADGSTYTIDKWARPRRRRKKGPRYTKS